MSAMDNLNTHSAHAVQPQGQQANGFLAVPPSQVLVIEQQGTNLALC